MPQIYSKSLAEITDTGDDFDYGPNGGFTAILSTPSLDRDGDRLARTEWVEPFQKSYPLDIDHGMTVADTVGSFEPFFDGDTLKMRAFFAGTSKAQDVRALVMPDKTTGRRHINSVSVAFMNDKAAQKDGAPHRELLNAGIVAIGSNRDAVILASKAANFLADEIKAGTVSVEEMREALGMDADDTDEAPEDTRTVGEVISDLFNFDGTKSVKAAGNEGALLQAIHDASSHLGALCVQLQQEESGETEPKSVSTFVIGTKSVIGTLEDLRERLCRELCASYPNDYPYPRATFLDDGGRSGTVVYELGDDLWAATFTDDGADVEIDDDNARPVGLITTIVEDTDTEGDKSLSKSFDEKFDEVVKTATEVAPPQETSADSPAEEEPAPDVKSAAASTEAAVDADESAGELESLQLMEMELELFVSEL